MGDRLTIELAQLRRVVDYIERTPLVVREMPRQRQLYLEAAWTRVGTLLLGHVTLFDAGLPSEANVLGRSVVEHAINVAWVGEDPERFERWWRDGARQRKKWTDGIVRVRPDVADQSGFAAHRRVVEDAVASEPPGFRLPPPLAQRAKAPHDSGLRPRTEELYGSSYRYLCNDAHIGLMAQLGLVLDDSTEAAWFDARHVVRATSVLLEVLGRALGMAGAVELAAELG